MVGTQINGAPHLGTNLVQTVAFLLAKIARREFSIDTRVRYGALTTPPTRLCSTWETYTDQQASPGFRAEFLQTLERQEDIRWWMEGRGLEPNFWRESRCPRCGEGSACTKALDDMASPSIQSRTSCQVH